MKHNDFKNNCKVVNFRLICTKHLSLKRHVLQVSNFNIYFFQNNVNRFENPKLRFALRQDCLKGTPLLIAEN
jgi:hypothetical protein